MNKVRKGQYGFPIMQDILPEGKTDNASLEYFTISDSEARMAVMKATYGRDYLGRHIYAGDFVRLIINNQLMFTDTGGERYSNYEIVQNSHGKVLIAGLGLGMVLAAIVPKPEVKKVVVIEISQDVINLVEPHIRNYLGKFSPKLEIVCSDIYDYVPTEKFNTIFFDIWGDYSGDTYEDTKKLHRKFSKYLNRTDSPYMNSWMRWHMKELHFQNNW